MYDYMRELEDRFAPKTNHKRRQELEIKRQEVATLAKTQKECKEKLKWAIEENAKVDTIRAEQYTVGQWMDVWFENCAKIKVRPLSHKTYRGYIDNHIKPSIGKIPLNKLSSLDLQKLYKKLLSDGRVHCHVGGGHGEGGVRLGGIGQGHIGRRDRPPHKGEAVPRPGADGDLIPRVVSGGAVGGGSTSHVTV